MVLTWDISLDILDLAPCNQMSLYQLLALSIGFRIEKTQDMPGNKNA